MNDQFAQTPTQSESVTVTLTLEELQTLLDITYGRNIYNKLKFLLPNTGGACFSPVMPSGAGLNAKQGQEGTNA